MTRFALIALLALGLSAPAQAAEKKDDKKEVGQYVDLSPVALPIVVNGRLINYIFVSVRLTLSGQANPARLRAKEPFFRDALIRAAHRTPFTNPTDYQSVDASRLKATLLREARAIGGDDVTGVEITNQTPKKPVAQPLRAGRPGANDINP